MPSRPGTPRIMVEVVTLSEFATACRAGLETLATREGSSFHGFPRGACGPASELVMRLMKEELGLDGVYVCGVGHSQLRPNQSHAWVVVGEYIIDITHDQFASTGLAGWVHPRTSHWHAEFSDRDQREGVCMPERWPMYPFDGYAATRAVLHPGR
jgi:hypothetical protein